MPAYDPSLWPPKVQDGTNCYDYAADQRSPLKRGGSQPGRAHGRQIVKPVTCQRMIENTVADGFKPVARNDLCGLNCWKIALFVDKEGKDYHYYRQDSSGNWSHKRGAGPPEDKDANNYPTGNGDPITDPERANRDYGKYNYSHFCGYFCCCPMDVVIEMASADPPESPASHVGEYVAAAAPSYEITLTAPARLVSTSMSLVLPAGDLRISYAEPNNRPAVADGMTPAETGPTARALIRSGLPDPEWTLDDDHAARLQEMAAAAHRGAPIEPIVVRLPGFAVDGLAGPISAIYVGREGLVLTQRDGTPAYRADELGLLSQLIAWAAEHPEADEITGSFDFP